jgi:hypothetical protein
VETDDDNLPHDGFWQEREREVRCRYFEGQGWVNVYGYFIAQRIAWENGWAVLYHEPTVRQERNEHNLLRFRGRDRRLPPNGRVCRLLEGLPLAAGEEHIPDNMRLCYDVFIREGLIDAKELELLDAWFKDLDALTKSRTP